VRIVLYTAASLDGYIARKDGSIDWLAVAERPGEDYGYAAFLAGVDALVMGRRTYEQVLTFGLWPYPGKATYVFTSRDLAAGRDDVTFVRGPVEAFAADLAARGHRRVWLVGGGSLNGAFLRQGLVDELIVSIIPVCLGEGIPLFQPPGRDLKFDLLESRSFPTGVVQLHCRAKQPECGPARP
jgi:dihydrofolate reductase